ncbi:MAG TPA: hydrogenase nickel incorporation protein HypB [Thermoanaerobaculia bacterium]|nr:hydrogenase nickel incorporation protein HypB [Thermoanaerobaculia bacterium]
MCRTCGCSDHVKATVTDLASGRHVHLHRTAEAEPPHRSVHAHGGQISAPGNQNSGAEHSHAHDHDRAHDHDHSHAHAHEHGHVHEHAHPHDHPHPHDAGTRMVRLETAVLAKNDALAERNRAWLAGRQILALNLVSSPGSGKTSLLERTIRDLGADRQIAVIEGDQQTTFDAERIRATGAPTVQVNTGAGCHLEADMVWEALKVLRPESGALVLVENVGNLVCPALFDLGEAAKVAVLSVTEGEDKPAKYPHMFQASSLILLNKIDLLPHLSFDLDRCIGYARDVNPDAEVLPISVATGDGLDRWYEWIGRQMEELADRAFA